MTKSPGSQLKAQEGHSLESVTNKRQTDNYNQTAAQPQNTSVPDWIHVTSRFIGQWADPLLMKGDVMWCLPDSLNAVPSIQYNITSPVKAEKHRIN